MAMRVISSVPGQPYLYVYFTDDVPTRGWSYEIPSWDANDMIDDPVFVSPNRTTAIRLRWTPGGFVAQTLPVEYGQTEYVLMRSPSGALHAYGIRDNGTFYVQSFSDTTVMNREVQMTIMHKGNLVWVADNRQPMPRKGDV